MNPVVQKKRSPLVQWLLGLTGNPLEWSRVDKTLLAIAANLLFALPYAVWVEFLFDPSLVAAYYNSRTADTVRILFRLRAGVWVLLFLLGLLIRKRWPHNKFFMYLVLHVFAVTTSFYSYYFEPYTVPFAVGFFACAVIAFLLFERWAVIVAIVAGLATRAVIDIGHQTGLWPYAPLFKKQPFGEGAPPGVFFLGMNVGSVVLAACAFGALIYVFIHQEEREAQLEELSRTDDLTGLPNRRAFMEILEREFLRAHRLGRPLGLLMCDVDHFKNVNDTYGHPVGDEVLRRIGQVLAEGAREGMDTAGRIGGEEFAVLLAETDLEASRQVALRLAERIRNLSFETPSGSFQITVSLGVTTLQGDEPDADTLLEVADTLLYRAKRAGRNRVVAGVLSELSGA